MVIQNLLFRLSFSTHCNSHPPDQQTRGRERATGGDLRGQGRGRAARGSARPTLRAGSRSRRARSSRVEGLRLDRHHPARSYLVAAYAVGPMSPRVRAESWINSKGQLGKGGLDPAVVEECPAGASPRRSRHRPPVRQGVGLSVRGHGVLQHHILYLCCSATPGRRRQEPSPGGRVLRLDFVGDRVGSELPQIVAFSTIEEVNFGAICVTPDPFSGRVVPHPTCFWDTFVTPDSHVNPSTRSPARPASHGSRWTASATPFGSCTPSSATPRAFWPVCRRSARPTSSTGPAAREC